MHIKKLLIIIILLLSTEGLAFTKNGNDLALAGDIAQVAIPSAVFLTTLCLEDYEGLKQFIKGFALTEASTYFLKYTINSKRPNEGYQSFPSGHTAIAFFGSGFINFRYGWRHAIPAYTAAIFVGYTRIQAKAHWYYDVLGGAALGLACSYAFTSLYKHKTIIYPSVSENGVALHCHHQF